MTKKKGNKAMLDTVNFSIDTVRDIQAGKEFTQEDKEEILNNFVGLSKDNNSYWTPVLITNFIKELLDIPTDREMKIADLSAGIGNMAIPFITEYGKLQENIMFDLYELDDNTSSSTEVAWSDFKQVNVHKSFDSINGDIPDNCYDYVLGNPPFSGSVLYHNKEWCSTKPTKKLPEGKAKNANIADVFVDLSMKKVKDKGYIAQVLPLGHLFKTGSTEDLRDYMKKELALKFVCHLDTDTFAKAGLKGTSVPTVICIYQKGVEQGKVFFGHLTDSTEDLDLEMKAMSQQYRKFNSDNYEITYRSDNNTGLYGILK